MKINLRVTLVNLFLISSLLSDTIIFNDGQQLKGKLEKITEKHPYDPNTGAEQEVLFKVEKYNLNTVPKNLVINKTADNVFMFDVKSIYKIEDDYGMLIYSSNKKLIAGAGIGKVNPETGNTLEIFKTDLIIKKDEKINKIPQDSEISIYFYKPVSAFKTNDAVSSIIGGGLTYGVGGLLLGVAAAAIPSRMLEEVQYQGIGLDSVSQKYFVKTNRGAFEIANIRKMEYVTDRQNRAMEGFLIYGGIPLAVGGLLMLADPGANTANMGPGMLGALLVIASPFAAIYGAGANWSVPVKKGFDIYKGAWEFDLDSMLSNNKPVEQN